MPIAFNLLEEERLAEIAKQRDPVKITVLFLVVCLAIEIVWGLNVYFKNERLEQDVKSLQDEKVKLTADFNEYVLLEKNYQALDVYRTDLQVVHNKRHLMAPLWATIKEKLPRTYILDSLQIQNESKSVPNPNYDPTKKGSVPTLSDWKVKCVLNGRIFSDEPENVVTSLLESIGNQKIFGDSVISAERVSYQPKLAATDIRKADEAAATFQMNVFFARKK